MYTISHLIQREVLYFFFLRKTFRLSIIQGKYNLASVTYVCLWDDIVKCIKTYAWYVKSFWLNGIYVISNVISPQMLISRQAFSCFISYNVTTFDIPALWKTKAISIFNERFFTTCFKKITQKRRKSFYLLSSNVSISKISDAIKNSFPLH